MTPHRIVRQLSLAAWALAGLAHGAEPMDFAQCVSAALAQNPDLEISRSQILQAEAGLQQAEGGHLPRIDLSLAATHTNDPLNAFGLKLGQERIAPADLNTATLNDPKSINNLNYRVALLWPVYTGGQTRSQVQAAESLVRAAQAGDVAARQLLTQQVLMAYQGVHNARAQLAAAAEAQAAADEYLRVTSNMHAQGVAVKSDVLSAKVNQEETRVRVAAARNGVANALDRLRLVMGKPLDEPLEVGPDVLPRMPAGELPELRRQAVENHAQLKALRARLEAVSAQVASARAARRPRFDVLLRQDWNDDNIGLDASSQTVAGVLSWNAYDGGASRARQDQAEAARLEASARLRQAEDAVALQVGEVQRKAVEAETRIAVRELAVAQAEEARRLVKKRYENGMATMVELLATQTQLDLAKADLVDSRYALAIQRGELLRAMGVLQADQM